VQADVHRHITLPSIAVLPLPMLSHISHSTGSARMPTTPHHSANVPNIAEASFPTPSQDSMSVRVTISPGRQHTLGTVPVPPPLVVFPPTASYDPSSPFNAPPSGLAAHAGRPFGMVRPREWEDQDDELYNDEYDEGDLEEIQRDCDAEEEMSEVDGNEVCCGFESTQSRN
jgi:hypothetical protein